MKKNERFLYASTSHSVKRIWIEKELRALSPTDSHGVGNSCILMEEGAVDIHLEAG